jgi:hypothetical protein
MANRHAPPIDVPFLNEKLAYLYCLSRDVRGPDDLGACFASSSEPAGVTAKAVKNWLHNDVGTRNAIPALRFDRLVEIFRDRIPGRRTAAEVRALLTSKHKQDLLAALIAGIPSMNWISRALEAEPSGAAIVAAGSPGVLDVTRRHKLFEASAGRVMFQVEARFRFKLERAWEGWLTPLQWSRSGWYGLEISDERASVSHVDFTGLLPLTVPFYCEDETGGHRYLFIYTAIPLPPEISSVLVTSARAPAPLDAGILDRLAHLADETAGFRLTFLDVTFVGAGSQEAMT